MAWTRDEMAARAAKERGAGEDRRGIDLRLFAEVPA